ncbi:hypothetical protein [Legionella fallonii]|uniref:Uncharacterized protein n=1 Tax=Legionella fallonii LLAP-10 TaxID=1212491 RepID=A0A098G2Z1_9GAMM|nr:hypothetical protein [Legionella fallonii]CEG56356.1 exported protein of unknown function [Legionella fallonii LLAP-10]
MKKKWKIYAAFSIWGVSTNLFALANAPMQRIDVVNLLWNSAVGGNGGLTNTAVTLSFYNGASKPCFTTTLQFQGAVTVWSGVGQNCVAPVTDIAITPIAGPIGLVYQAPADSIISTSYYSTQLVVGQFTAPVFDPTNATLMAPGTVLATITNY